jgi:hypothetical protein
MTKEMNLESKDNVQKAETSQVSASAALWLKYENRKSKSLFFSKFGFAVIAILAFLVLFSGLWIVAFR